MPLTQKQIGTWLAEQREAAGLTQMEAAARLGKQSGLVSKWERGQLRMSAESFLSMVSEYNAAAELAKWLRVTARSWQGYKDVKRKGGTALRVAETPARYPMRPISPAAEGVGRARKGGAKGK